MYATISLAPIRVIMSASGRRPKIRNSDQVDNKILHNLFITTRRHAVQFAKYSTHNEFANNVLVGVRIDGSNVVANPSALLMEVDGTVGKNTYRGNLYISGRLEGRRPGTTEIVRRQFSIAWFARFPAAINRDPGDFLPAPDAPQIGSAIKTPLAAMDRNGIERPARAAFGPGERR